MLARVIRKRVGDPHYAEGIFILALAMIAIGLVMFFFIGWASLQPFMGKDLAYDSALIKGYFFSQVAAGLLFFFFCLLGHKPELQVVISDNTLNIVQGEDRQNIPLDSIKGFSTISALQFHRHYRKYVNTRSFFVRLPRVLLLLSTDTGPVVLGLSLEDQEAVTDLLIERTTYVAPPVPVV